MAPSGELVLGGIEGAKQRLAHPAPSQRIAALQQLRRYGNAGLEAIAQTLHDPAVEVQRAAYALLQGSSSAIAQHALSTYCVYPLFDQCGILHGHAQGITAIALSPDETTIVSSSRDRTVNVWDREAQEAFLTFKAPFFVHTLTISPDGRSVLLRDTDHQLSVWSLRNGQELPADGLMAWNLDGLAAASRFSLSLPDDDINQLKQGWLDDEGNGASSDETLSNPFTDQTNPFKEPEKGSDRPKPRSIASTTLQGDRYLISSSQSSIRIWDLHQGREVAVLRGHTSLVTAIAAAPSRQWVISGSEDRTIRIWGIP